MKQQWMTTKQREDALLRLLMARENTISLRQDISAARLACPHIVMASKKWSVWAETMTHEIDSIIAQVRAIPVVDVSQPALPDAREIEAVP